MWYLLNVDDGIVMEANKKSDIVSAYGYSKRMSNGEYEVFDTGDTPRPIGFLYKSKEHAINNGWSWAFEKND